MYFKDSKTTITYKLSGTLNILISVALCLSTNILDLIKEFKGV